MGIVWWRMRIGKNDNDKKGKLSSLFYYSSKYMKSYLGIKNGKEMGNQKIIFCVSRTIVICKDIGNLCAEYKMISDNRKVFSGEFASE